MIESFASTRNAKEIRAEVNSYKWHHSIDFGDGVVSKGGGKLAYMAEQSSAMFDGLDLHGRTLLDIGAWNGAFSFEAKRRGCKTVLATDHYCWNHPEFKGRETFELAKRLLGMDIDAMDIDVPDIKPQTVGTFDVVLFSGVFYHLINPVHLTRQISECASNVLIVETWQDMLDYNRPGMVFYPGVTLNKDGSNWWGPNPRAMYEILKECGFSHIFYQDAPRRENPDKSSFRTRGIYHAFRTWEGIFEIGGPHPSWMHLENPEIRKQIFKPVKGSPFEELIKLRAENEAIRKSTSWRVTAPLRALKRAITG